MRWILTYSLASIGGIVGFLALLWAFSGFTTGGLPGPAIAAIVLGVAVSILIAVGSMALVFHSDRSGRDEQVHRPDDDLRQ